MQTGKLNKRIKIDRPNETQNDLQEVVIEYVFWQEVWASIEPLNGKEFLTAQQIQSDVSTRIRIRYLEGINQKHRIRFDREATGSPTVTDYYEIDAVIPVMEDRRQMDLMCRKLDAEGARIEGSL